MTSLHRQDRQPRRLPHRRGPDRVSDLRMAPVARILAFLAALFLVSVFPLQAAPIIGAPNATSGDYEESTEDLRVKVQGGFVTVDRTWSQGTWQINPRWNPLLIVRDPADDGVKYIERNGEKYEPTANDPARFRFGKRKTIVRVAAGYRWSDQDGSWIDYDDGGRATGYGNRTAAAVALRYDGDGRRSGVYDHRGEQVLWYDYDAAGQLVRIRDDSGRQVQYAKDPAGQIVTVTDARANTWTYGYSAGLLTGKTDPAGHTITLSYNAQKRLIKIEDALGPWRTYLYDYDKTTRQFLFRVTDSTGTQTDTWYERDGRLVRREVNGQPTEQFAVDGDWRVVTDWSGLATRLRDNDRGDLVETVFADGTRVINQYDPHLSVITRTTNEVGIVTRYEYDAVGNRTRMVEALGTPQERTTEYAYDAFGNLLRERRLGDAVTAEAVTVYTYDAWGNRVTVTDPEQQVTRFTFDVGGNPLKRTDALGNDWLYTYDAAGLRTAETNPLDQTATTSYDKLGNPIRIVDRNGHATSYTYDVRNNRISVTNALGQTRTTTCDGEGRPLEMTDAAGQIKGFRYDAAGRLMTMIEAGDERTELSYAGPDEGVSFNAPKQVTRPGATEVYGYDRRGRRNRVAQTPIGGATLVTTKRFDGVGQQVSETDPAGRTRAAVYDALSRITSITDPLGGSQVFGYDNRNNLISVQNQRDIVIRRYSYDRANRLVAEGWPNGGSRTFVRDPVGHLIETLDAKGQVVRNVYDAAGRQVQTRWFGDGATVLPLRTIDYRFDPVGNRIGYSDGDRGAVVTYDAVNRKTAEQIDFGTFEAGFGYEYNAAGRKAALIYPDGMREAFSYDAAGQLAGIEVPDLGMIAVGGYTRGKPTQWRFPGGLSRSFAYDGLGRMVTSQGGDGSGGIVMNHHYRYDEVGNLIARDTEHGAYQFRYDALNRLTAADNPTLSDETYAYDPVGNRVASVGHPVWSYGDADELLSDGDLDYAYDANGNLISKARNGTVLERFDYDSADHLVEARGETGERLGRYAYDPMGRMIRRDTDHTVWYLYADEGLIAELDDTGAITRRFGWQPAGTWGTNPLWQTSQRGAAFSLNDQIGTPWKQVGNDGRVLWDARYRAFGAAQVVTGAPMDNPWRLPGQYLVPELGTHYNYHRFYDPAAGRYQRFDPLGIRASANTYVYAFNNPLTVFDPYGLFCKSGAGANLSGCATGVVGVGGSACAEVKCCHNQCGDYCCSYFKFCVCIGFEVGVGVSAGIAAGDCSVSVAFSGGVTLGCGDCSLSVSTTEVGGSCCHCEEAAKRCS